MNRAEAWRQRPRVLAFREAADMKDERTPNAFRIKEGFVTPWLQDAIGRANAVVADLYSLGPHAEMFDEIAGAGF